MQAHGTTDSSNNYQYKLYSSIAEIDENLWRQVVHAEHDLAMDRNLILLTEKSLAKQAKFWHIIIFHQQKPVACACLSLFRTDTLQSAPLSIQRGVERLRHFKPNLLKLGVLFCGLPVPCANMHFRINNSPPAPILELITQVMYQLARKEKASLLVVKELTVDQVEKYQSLRQHGFLQGTLAPMHELKANFTDFNHYKNTLRSRYRLQVKQNLKKFTKKNIQVLHSHDPDEIYQQFTDEVYQLYLAVWQRSKEKLEQFPASFRELAYALPGNTLFTFIKCDDKPIAFTVGIRHQDHYHNLYCGIDYALKDEIDLYFNLFYIELDQAFKQNFQTIFLGQTSDSFKSRLGTIATSRHFYVRAKNPLSHLGLKLFNRWIFPNPPLPPQQHVFKEEGVQRKKLNSNPLP